jgi:putative ABC transport system substrate-binding protein
MILARRGFITLLGATAAWPLTARAQQSASPVIGLLSAGAKQQQLASFKPLLEGLKETGYVPGQNLSIEERWAENQFDRLPAMAADLVRRGVMVIVTIGGPPSTLAAKAATSTIPILFSLGIDPVETRLVASLAHPGGNLTGVSMLLVDVMAKRLEMLHEMVPAATSIALLTNPGDPALAAAETKELEAATRALGLRLEPLSASKPNEIDTAFDTFVGQRLGALVVSSAPDFTGQAERIAALAVRHAVPTAYAWPEYTQAGGLMSYGPNRDEIFRQVGRYAGRILKGEKPADLPVVQITKLEMTINLRAAKALGLTAPLPLLAAADEVIE